MKKTNFKKALSVFLSVLMIMSCWVWVAPTEAEAADASAGVTTSLTLSPNGNRGATDWTRLALTGESSAAGTSVVLFRFSSDEVSKFKNVLNANLQFYAYSCRDRLTQKSDRAVIVYADVYYITKNSDFVSNYDDAKNKNVTDTNNAVLGSSFSDTYAQNSAKSYFGLSDATFVGSFEQPDIDGQTDSANQSGAVNVVLPVTEVLKAKANAGEDLAFIVMLRQGYSCSGSAGWSDVYINSDTISLSGTVGTYIQINDIAQLKSEIDYYESCVENDGNFYTNMYNNYRAYNNAKRYYDAVVYGGVEFDADTASNYYSDLHGQMYENTVANTTYVDYLNAPISSRDGSTVNSEYRKNVIWYPWDFSWDITSNSARPVIQDTYFYFTMPNTIVGITDDSETTFPLHSFFWTTTGSRYVRYVIAGSGTTSSGVVGSSDFSTMAPWKISNDNNTHTTSGLNPGTDGFGGWVFEKNYRTDVTLDNFEDNSNNFSYSRNYVYQISSYAQINKSSIGVNASNVYKKVNQGFTFATSKSGNNGSTNYGNHYASNYSGFGGHLYVVYMDTYKNNYQNWRTLFPALSYKNYDGYVYNNAINITDYLDEASALQLSLGLSEAQRTQSIDSTVQVWATNVNRGAASLASAKSAGTTRVTDKYVDLTDAIKAADSIIASGGVQYTATSWNNFVNAYNAARNHMASLNPATSNAQYSSDSNAIGNLATALTNAQAALQYLTVTYKYFDGTVAKTLSAANGDVQRGTTAAELATNAPSNTSKKPNDANSHYTYSWPSFATVTDSATYQEVRATEGHTTAEKEENRVEATCGKDGSYVLVTYCSVCNAELSRENKTISATGNHVLGEWITDSEPTCTTAGSKHRDCTNCDYSETEEIAATGTHTEEIIAGKEATCKDTGLTEGKKCSVCGEILLAQETIPVLPHTEEVIAGKEATCKDTGLTEGKKCSACGEILVAQTVIEKKAHTEEILPAIEATCTSTGLTEGKKCSVCGETLVAQTDIPVLDHSLGDWITDKEPTCITAGSKHKECANCEYKLTEEIPATGNHVYGEWTQYGDKHRRTCIADVDCTASEEEAHNFNGAIRQMDGGNFHQYKCEKCEAYGVGTTMNIGEACYGEGATVAQIADNASQHKVTCKCGREKTEGHAYSDWAADPENTSDANGKMSRTCSDCSFKQTTYCTYIVTETEEATCTADGHTTYKCKDCGNGYTDIHKRTGHDFSEVTAYKAPTCSAEGNKAYKTCKVCTLYFAENAEIYSAEGKTDNEFILEIDANAHSWDEGKVTKAATCSAEGEKLFTCQNDNSHTKTESIAIDEKAHSWNEGIITKDPTCSAEGVKTFTCQHNGGHTKTEPVEIDANAHSWNEGVITKDPTCSAEGVKTFTCQHNGGHTKTEPVAIDPDAHSWNEGVITKDPTCSAEGVKTFTCQNDGAHTREEAVALDADAHNYGEWIEEIPATCVATGTKGHYMCSVCSKYFDAEKNEITDLTLDVDSDNHDIVNHEAKTPTCTEIGWDAYETCSRCDYTTYAEKAALDHNYESVVTAPTCTEQGYTTHTCTRCGDSYVDSYVDALDHDWSDYTTVSAATCLAAGEEKRTCKRADCGAFETREIKMLEHSYTGGEYTYNTNTKKHKELCVNGCNDYGNETDCDFETKITAPTCVDGGYTTYSCKCGYSYNSDYESNLGHDYKYATGNGTSHAVTCSRCDYTATENCSGGEAYCNAQATCEKCKTVYGEKNGNNHVKIVQVDAQDKTCTEAGWEAYEYCTECDYTTKVEIPASHKLKNADAKAPTCYESGWEAYEYCTACDYTTYVELPALNHKDTLVKVDAKAATCTAIGWYAYEYCTACDYTTYVELPVDADAHSWDEGKVTTEPTCTEKGVTTYTCKYNEEHTKTEDIAALKHIDVNNDGYCDRENCKALICDHVDTGRDTTDEKEATCLEAGYTGDTRCSKCKEIVTSGTVIPQLIHKDENKDHACDNGCGVVQGEHADSNKDHACDYGCAVTFGTCEDNNKDHNCDYGCNKYYGTHADADKDHACDYGCDVAFGTCADDNKDHKCDYGCSQDYGTHEDTDKNHICDYGCSVAIGTCADDNTDHKCDYGCGKDYGTHADADKDHACDYGCSEKIGVCEDSDKDHKCDYGCDVAFGTCADGNKDHKCDYGCSAIFGVCEDSDKDHKCDYGCDVAFGTCADGNKDHKCDYGCSVVFGECADSADDNDHVCDYGCGKNLENCADGDDNNHNCDVCGKDGISEHKWVDATCDSPKTCSICNATEGNKLGHDFDKTKSEENLTRPVQNGDGTWSKGYYTYTCKNDSSHKDIEEVDRAAYTAYENALANLNSLLATDITEEAKTAINEAISENKVANNLIASEQSDIDNATVNLVKAFEDNNASLKTYTVTFVIDGVETKVSVISGQDATAPTVVEKKYDDDYHYNFTGWDEEFTNITDDLTVTAEFEAVAHSYSHTDKDDEFHTDSCTCGYSKDVEHTETSAVTTKASCYADGVRTYTCSVCSGTRTEVIEKRAHNIVDTTVALDPTCSAKGIQNQKCDNAETDEYEACAYTTTRDLDKVADAHKAEADYTVIKKANCEENGYKAILCKYCDAELSTATIEKRAHTYVDNGVQTEATCEADGVMKTICSNLETDTHDACVHESTRVIEKLDHSYTGEYKWNNYTDKPKTHSQLCVNGCGKYGNETPCEFETSVTEPDCYNSGYTTYTCKVCNNSYDSDYTNREHKFVYSAGDGTQHIVRCQYDNCNYTTAENCSGGEATCGAKAICEKCETAYGSTLEHSFTKYEVTEEAKCGVAGKEVAYCDNNCGETDEKEIPALTHKPLEAVKENEVAPKCEVEGSYDLVVYCELCSAKLSSETKIVGSIGHDYVGVETKAPSCDEEGLMTYTCKNDASHTYTEVLPSGVHKIVIDKAVEPDCVNTGLTLGKHCSECGTVILAQNVIPAKGHIEITLPAVDATCTVNGKTEGKYCSRCSMVIVPQEVIPSFGHTEEILPAKEPTCSLYGLTEGVKCAICNTVIVAQEKIPMLSHTDKNNDGICDECYENFDYNGRCVCICHNNHWFWKVIIKIIMFLWRMFDAHPVCVCGVGHY